MKILLLQTAILTSILIVSIGGLVWAMLDKSWLLAINYLLLYLTALLKFLSLVKSGDRHA